MTNQDNHDAWIIQTSLLMDSQKEMSTARQWVIEKILFLKELNYVETEKTQTNIFNMKNIWEAPYTHRQWCLLQLARTMFFWDMRCKEVM